MGPTKKTPGLRSRSGPGIRMSMAGGSARALPLDLSLRVGFCRQSRFFIGSALLVCASLNVALRGLDRLPVSVSLRPLVSVCDFIYLVDVAVKEMMQGRGSSGALARVS